jgi:hypothetical protein
MVYVRCGEAKGLIKLDGDDTRLVSGDIPDPQSIVDRVNRLRIPEKTQEQTSRRRQ